MVKLFIYYLYNGQAFVTFIKRLSSYMTIKIVYSSVNRLLSILLQCTLLLSSSTGDKGCLVSNNCTSISVTYSCIKILLFILIRINHKTDILVCLQ